MAAVEGPLRLAVADDEGARGRHCGGAVRQSLFSLAH